jgi:hypothetical protein
MRLGRGNRSSRREQNKRALQFHFVHHKSKTTWPVVRPGRLKVLKWFASTRSHCAVASLERAVNRTMELQATSCRTSTSHIQRVLEREIYFTARDRCFVSSCGRTDAYPRRTMWRPQSFRSCFCAQLKSVKSQNFGPTARDAEFVATKCTKYIKLETARPRTNRC